MSKRTNTKKMREWEMIENKEGRKVPVKRSETLPAAEIGQVPCQVCNRPLNKAQGQIARVHRACRSLRPVQRSVFQSTVKQAAKMFDPRDLIPTKGK